MTKIMKKTYIAPEATEYKVNTKDGVMLSQSNTPADPNKEVETKEEGETSIWNLY